MRACSQQLHDSTARSHGAGPSTTLTHLRPAQAFKPRQGPPRWVSAAHSPFAPPTLHKCNIASSVGRHLVRCPLPRPTAHGPRRSDPPFTPTGTGLRQKFGSPVLIGPLTLCWRRRRCPSPPTRNRARVSTGAAHLTRRQAPRIRGTHLGGPNTHPSSFPQGVSKQKR